MVPTMGLLKTDLRDSPDPTFGLCVPGGALRLLAFQALVPGHRDVVVAPGALRPCLGLPGALRPLLGCWALRPWLGLG